LVKESIRFVISAVLGIPAGIDAPAPRRKTIRGN